jgi:hypothetical protein
MNGNRKLKSKKIQIMRYFISSLILFLIILSSFAQKKKNCNCDGNSFLENIVLCDTINFKNGASLYWQYTCDSSWLTFENHRNKKILTELNGTFISYAGRLGYIFAKEYERTLLFVNKHVSGAGSPLDYELLNKDNGEVLKVFGRIIYSSDDMTGNYILYLGSLDTLNFYNIESDKIYSFSIPSGQLYETCRESTIIFPEYLFDKPKTENHSLIISYKYLVNKSPEQWISNNIFIDLSKTK